LNDYRWEYKLIDNKIEWLCSGKIIVYSGTNRDDAGLAVMGHEVSHIRRLIMDINV
jgi:Zn-dependent protease with chaperone function